jgi:hypothetical protein
MPSGSSCALSSPDAFVSRAWPHLKSNAAAFADTGADAYSHSGLNLRHDALDDAPVSSMALSSSIDQVVNLKRTQFGWRM